MLHRYFNPFLQYFKLANFAKRSIEAVTGRGKEFRNHLISNKINSVKKVSCQHRVEFTTDFDALWLRRLERRHHDCINRSVSKRASQGKRVFSVNRE